MVLAGTVRDLFKRLILMILIGVTWGLFFVYLVPFATLHVSEGKGTPDYIQHYTGASVAKSGEIRNLYDLDFQRHVQNALYGIEDTGPRQMLTFRMPPVSAYLYSPLAYFSADSAFWLATYVTTTLIILAFLVLSKHTDLTNNSVRFTWALLPFFLPVWQTFVGVHVSGLLLLVISAVYFSIKKEQFLLGGLLTGLLFLKPNYLLIIPFILSFLRTRDSTTKYFAGVSASVIFMVLLNSVLYGADFLPSYVRYLGATENLAAGTLLSRNINLISIAALFTANDAYAKLFGLILIGLLLPVTLFLIHQRRHTYSVDRLFITSLLFMPLFNIHTMMTDLIVYIMPLVLIAPKFLSLRRLRRSLFFIFILILSPAIAFANLEATLTLIYLCFAFWYLLKYSEIKNPENELLVRSPGNN